MRRTHEQKNLNEYTPSVSIHPSDFIFTRQTQENFNTPRAYLAQFQQDLKNLIPPWLLDLEITPLTKGYPLKLYGLIQIKEANFKINGYTLEQLSLQIIKQILQVGYNNNLLLRKGHESKHSLSLCQNIQYQKSQHQVSCKCSLLPVHPCRESSQCYCS